MSTKLRAVVGVPHPATKVLQVEDVYPRGAAKPEYRLLLEHFKQEGRISNEACIRILSEVTEVLRLEPNVLNVPAPVSIVGDIHGQFFDLVKLFQVGGDPANTRYLFLGDYVDRGYFSLECVIYLWALKLNFPKTIHLLRGNHECRHLTEYFTFKTEVEYKNSEEVYDVCMDSFDCLPIVAIMNKQFFCVHGGLSPDIYSVKDVEAIDRFCEPDETGPLCDLLWADPHEDYDTLGGSHLYLQNETRGCSFVYTKKAVCDFLDSNSLLSVIRAHEAQDQGYRMYKQNPKTSFPSVITLFSAPNYLDVYGNKAAVMIYAENSMNIKKFSHSTHPYWLPNFMDVFTWSLPFIGEKTTEMLHSVLHVCTDQELAAAEKDDSGLEGLAKKMQDTLDLITAQKTSYGDQASRSEQALVLHGLTSPTGESPPVSFDDLASAMQTFDGVKTLDKHNEKKPSQEKKVAARQNRRRQTLDDIRDPMVGKE
eukprot:m.432321 g.432321  ORF g.432321 m.432321 type:complete len:480 (+) comp17418_c0_seq1:101-1540(+)